jgi:predicted porin
MLKKLLPVALAMAAIGATGAAHAQTAVVLYGIADGGFRLDHTAIGNLKSMESGGEAQSRWGIRGSEDLGGGLKAIFNFEQDFDLGDNSVDQGLVSQTTPSSPVNGVTTAGQGGINTTSRLFGRRAIVGLNSTTWGELRFGRDTTPSYNVWVPADMFGNGTTGRTNNIAQGNQTRFDNAVSYDSPIFYGFQAKAMVRLGESTTDNATASKGGGGADSWSLTYAQGPVYAGIGYVHVKSAIDVGPAPLDNPSRSYVASATYDFGFMKIGANYFHTKNQTTVKAQSYETSIAVPVGAWRIMGKVGRIDNKFDTANSPLQHNDANFFAVGASYALSKRTDIYMSWAKFVNQGAAAFFVMDQGAANGLQTAANVPSGFNPWSAETGIRFLF